MQVETLLLNLAALSREFGAADYVLGGGGNSSVKTADTLWVKASGTVMAEQDPSRFVKIDRARLAALYSMTVPPHASEREARVKELMGQSVEPGCTGRASVEAPLHDSLDFTYVIHTHPALVNGLTCARDGRAAARRLFPDALWIDYIDPGYTLCMHVRERIADYRREHGAHPRMILLKNHGVFIAGDTPDEIREHYAMLMERLASAYAQAGVDTALSESHADDETVVRACAKLQELLGDEAAACESGGRCPIAVGPLTPDHIVYMRSYPYVGEPTAEGLDAYRRAHGGTPMIFTWDSVLFAAAPTPKKAALALAFARDGARIVRLAAAFGGVEYLSDASRRFIENWEVESYRSQQL